MNKSQWLIGLSTLALVLTACNAGEEPSNNAAVPSPQAPQPAVKAPAPQTFPKPSVVASGSIKRVPVAGLTQSTDIPTRLTIISKGRRDPFAGVVPTPIALTVQSPPTKPVPALSPVPVVAPTGLPTVGVGTVSLPTVQPGAPGVTPVSPTRDANAVAVTGVVQLPNQLSAIVKVPEEQTSRSVSAGEYLANGKVLVKRIEAVSGGEPVVVLEQNGIEVIKSVGSPVAAL